jgi:hypothetical protein
LGIIRKLLDFTEYCFRPILSAVSWATNDIVSAIWMNRVQNKAFIVTYLITQSSYTMEIV